MTQEQLEKAVELHKKSEAINGSIAELKKADYILVGEDSYNSKYIYESPEIITQIMYIYEVEKQRIEQQIMEL